MGKDLASRFEHARLRYQEASESLNTDLARICFEGPEDELRQTRITQPALFVHSAILVDLLRERGVSNSAAAGHSLGEYSALYSAGVFNFTDGLRLVKARADAMQVAGENNPGTMGAIVGLEDSVVEEICAEASGAGVVIPANYNSPGQVVVSGTIEGVQKALDLAKLRGARLAKELTVSGAFHSPLMKSAAEVLQAALLTTKLSHPALPVLSNVTAKPHSTAESARELLVQQLLSPVRWTESMQALALHGNVRWFEVGSGNVLSGLLKRTVKGAAAEAISAVADLDRVTASPIATV